MTPTVLSIVAVTYVRDINTSRAFYELLGFREQRSGSSSTSALLALHHNEHTLVLASTQPSLDIPRLPLLIYFFYDDVDAALAIVKSVGLEACHMGYPPHALGGEVKLLDPDGNTVLIGQRQRSAKRARLSAECDSRHEIRRPTATCAAFRPGGNGTQRHRRLRLPSANAAGNL